MAIRSGTVLRRRTLFEEAVDIIEREYASELELDAVARRLATSRRQLQRAFAEAGQTSFRTSLAEVRMRRALEMLREGSLPVREVAGRVGYRQAAQFAKTFRRHHGRPPSSFRREGRREAEMAGGAGSRDGVPGEGAGGNLDGTRPSLAYSTAPA
jgi:transcriptional regulator GlxA family with amidase domain